LLVSAGGVLGSLSRFLLGLVLPDTANGNLAANIIGAGIAAHLLVLMERRGITWARYFLLPGFCGGLTTFSGVTFEVMRKNGSGFSYLLINVLGSLVAVAIILPLSRKVIKERA
jgi:CrcB protein